MKLLLAAGLVTATLAIGCALLEPGNPARINTGLLVGPNGMTLYVFDRDSAHGGRSVCNGPCAGNWPPLLASDNDKPVDDYTIITRDDGKKQWVKNGRPLYYWFRDARPGDTSGDSFMNVWHIARP
ncbi:MAG: hypothetical protein H7228_05930 [Polaromonas sp.]|nr:hypothetical protein [Polaromonas sp.]